jgi:hypothetical protein
MMNNPLQFIDVLKVQFKTEIKKVKDKDIQKIEKIIKDNPEAFEKIMK